MGPVTNFSATAEVKSRRLCFEIFTIFDVFVLRYSQSLQRLEGHQPPACQPDLLCLDQHSIGLHTGSSNSDLSASKVSSHTNRTPAPHLNAHPTNG